MKLLPTGGKLLPFTANSFAASASRCYSNGWCKTNGLAKFLGPHTRFIQAVKQPSDGNNFVTTSTEHNGICVLELKSSISH